MPFQAKSVLLKEKKDPKKSDFMENQSNLEVRDILNRLSANNRKGFRMFPCTQKRDQESESINSQKETHIRFLIHPLEIFLLMFPN